MSNRAPIAHHPVHGQLGYLQVPAFDVARSAAFYEAVLGWSVELEYASFNAPGLIGQFVTDRSVGCGPVLWFGIDALGTTLPQVIANGGAVHGRPRLDRGERWLVEIDDPAGNRIGLFAAARTAQPQTLIAVRDVEAASAWYRALFGWQSEHGGPDYERLSSDGVLVMQLHRWEVEHHHGAIGDPAAAAGNGVLLWFGEVADFDAVVERARRMDAPIVTDVQRNPPSGDGNGPAHRELWVKDLDGYTVVIASPDGEAFE